ncbi:MAG: NDP-sugar synthase [Planctomycetota bacterium]
MEKNSTSRAIIFSLRGARGFADGESSPMSPLIDRPFLQHTIECLVDRGFRTIDLILHEDASDIELVFGDGERWGIQLQYHLVRDPERPYSRLRIISAEAEPVLMVEGDLLQPEGWMECRPGPDGGPVRFVWLDEDSDERKWTGAAWIRSQDLPSLALSATREEFSAQFARLPECHQELVNAPLDGRTFVGLLASQKRLFVGEFPELMKCGLPNDDGVWIGRNTTITPDVRLHGPVFIGANVEIGAMNEIGPDVTILDGCFIGKGCEIAESILMPDTLAGEGLAIAKCVVDRHRLYNTEHRISFMVNDDVLIGCAHKPLRKRAFIRRTVARTLAFFVLLATLPIILIVALHQKLRYGTAFSNVDVVNLPTLENPPTWKTYTRYRITPSPNAKTNLQHLLFDFLPGMFNVFRGECGWVGVSSMTPSELESMPSDWMESYVGCDAGLVNESIITYGPGATPDEILTAEVYYAAVGRSFAGRAKRMAAYVLSIFIGPRVLRGNFLRPEKRKLWFTKHRFDV